MRHRLLAPADYRRFPWKNGRGSTTEIAQHPPGADYETFAWRASIAEIAHSGPFSQFAGVARSLVLIGGEGMRLDRAEGPLHLRAPFDMVEFDGDDAVVCSLAAGPVRAFNLMLRQGGVSGRVAVVRGGDQTFPPASFTLCHAALGATNCLLPGGGRVVVDEGSALVVEAADAPDARDAGDRAMPIRFRPASPRSVAVVATIASIASGSAPASRLGSAAGQSR